MHGDSPVCCPQNYFGQPPAVPVGTVGKHPECYLSQPGSTAAGIGVGTRRLIGCDVGCLPCLDDPTTLQGAGDTVNGSRWLRPDADEVLSVDARGMHHDLRSNEAHLVPANVIYQRGTCWDNDGFECFGWNVCSCYGDNAADVEPRGDPRSCGPGVLVGYPVKGLMPDQVFTQGHRWPLRSSGGVVLFGEGIHCRKFTDTLAPEPKTHTVAASATAVDDMLDPIFLHSSGRFGADIHKGTCSSSYFVPLAAKVAASTCPGSYAGGDYYNYDPASRSKFDMLLIKDITARLREESDIAVHIDLPTVRAKNRILEFARTHTFDDGDRGLNFEQLDHYYRDSDSALGVYRRTWNGSDLPVDQRPTIPDIFGACFLKYSRIPVTCSLHIRMVRMTVSLVPHRLIREHRFASSTEVCEPHARCRIQVLCTVAASIPGGSTLSQSWLPEGHPNRNVELSITNDLMSMPRVAPNLDEIVYVDQNGQHLKSLLRTEWWGFLGYHSEPSTRDQSFAMPWGSTIAQQATLLAMMIDRLKVPAWPYDAEGSFGPGDNVYEGDVTIGFTA